MKSKNFRPLVPNHVVSSVNGNIAEIGFRTKHGALKCTVALPGQSVENLKTVLGHNVENNLFLK
jgi:hypothetical protein